MLRIYYGRTHTGKTRQLFADLALAARSGKRGLLLLVPEQLSHEAERLLCTVGGDGISRSAEVLSFTRLAARVAAATGGVAAKSLDQGGRLLTMAKAAEQVRSRLRLYSSRTPEQLEQLVAAVDEFQSYDITPEQLRAASDAVDGTLTVKLEELSLLLESYLAACAQGAMDPRQRLQRLRDALWSSGYAEGRSIYIDGFSDFSAQELSVLGILLRDAETVSICLTCDDLDAGLDIFQAERETAARLRRLAERYHCPVELIRRTAQPERPAALLLVESALMTRQTQTGDAGDAVALYSAPNRMAECARAAARMRELAAQGMRWREMAVAYTDASYARMLAVCLRDHEIPVFQSESTPLLEKPVLALPSAALAAVSDGLMLEQTLAVLKTGLSGLEPEEADLLENYLRRWRIGGSDWAQVWRRHPDGYDGREDERSQARLASLNRSRERFGGALLRLRDAMLLAETVAQRVLALYTYLEEIGYRERLSTLAEALQAQGRMQEAQETGQLYQILCTALEQLYGVLGAQRGALDEFTALLKLTLSQYSVAAIPATLDAVTVGTLMALRRAEPKVLFVLGAEEGLLPSYGHPSGVFSERERAELRELGVELAPDAEGRLNQELAAAYQVFSAPSERLEVSYCADGSTQPSYLLTRLQVLFPDLAVAPAGADLSTLRHAAAHCLPLDGEPAHPALRDAVTELRRRAAWQPGRLSQSAVQTLYGRVLHLSASRLDQYANCRFAYLMKYGLRLAAPGEADLDAPAFGTFVHAVLERTAKAAAERGGFAALDDASVTELATGFIADYRQENEANFAQRDARFHYLFERHSHEVLAVVRELAAELRVSDFTPCAFELQFRRGAELPPVPVQGAHARGELVGAVDRVDRWQLGETEYVRVVDYKTGRKSFDFADVYNGIGMQMLLYLFALERGGAQVFGHPVHGAGVLYFPAREVLVSANSRQNAEALDKERAKQLKRRGLLRNSEAVLEAMEHGTDARYLPLRYTKDGVKSDYLADAEQLRQLSRFVEKRMGELADGIASGEVLPNPARRGSHDACRWCDYAAVCHLDAPCGAPRMLAGVKPAEFWEKIAQEVTDLG